MLLSDCDQPLRAYPDPDRTDKYRELVISHMLYVVYGQKQRQEGPLLLTLASPLPLFTRSAPKCNQAGGLLP